MNDRTQLFGDVGFHGLAVADVRQAAVVLVSLEFLAAVLGFPEGVRISAVKEADEAWRNTPLMLRIEGMPLEAVPDDGPLPPVTAVCERQPCGHGAVTRFVPVQRGAER